MFWKVISILAIFANIYIGYKVFGYVWPYEPLLVVVVWMALAVTPINFLIGNWRKENDR